MKELIIIGGGLSGSEAAWQAAERGIKVRLFEMRPICETGAHATAFLGELVCSNSLGSDLPDRASGILKREMERMGSLLMTCARETSVPAGGCLAVDRDGFAELITQRIEEHPNIELVREELTEIPDQPTIIASGPLTSPGLSEAIGAFGGQEHLYFYDAISPIIQLDSIDMDKAFRASRYGRGEQEEGDYINCALNKEEYYAFVDELVKAERIELESFEQDIKTGVRAGMHTYFEGCMPVEILAERGVDTMAYGPMRPVGIDDPRTKRWAHAVLQLRQDNLAGSCFNMVGFQTNLKFPEQKRVFAMIPGLENAEYLRYGQMHRNTFINAPELLRPTLQANTRDDLFFAGQITGVEGYAGNIATGVLAGINASRFLNGEAPWVLPPTTLLGALCHYVTHAEPKGFQPMKANLGILPPLETTKRLGKRERAAAHAERAMADLETYLVKNP
jgi:methylenetetrahydrofolate--tRNA-(uracil-5-)-methyltransferase